MKKLFIIIASLLFIVGISVLSYPYVSNWLAERNHSRAIQEYRTGVSEATAAILQEERQKAEKYNESITYETGNEFSFNPAITDIPAEYYAILNTKGIMGYINIPQINISLPIYHGTEDDVLHKGVGHIVNTTLPIGGSGNHSVLTGHSGLPSAKLFNDLEQLSIGDVFYLHVLEETLAYMVDEISVIEPTDTEFLISEENQDYVSLVTCTPYGINSHRLIVRGSRIPYSGEDEEILIEIPSFEIESWGYITAGIIFILLIIIIHISLLHIVHNPNKIKIWIITSLMFISGSCMLAYPSAIQYRYQEEVEKINTSYLERMKKMENTAYVIYSFTEDEGYQVVPTDESADSMADYIYKQMVKYNDRLFEERQMGLVDSSSYEQADIELKEFGYDENMIGYLKISKMNVELPIYLGANEINMKKGAVHLTNTSLPIGGNNTNAVIAAHRGINALPMFKNIEKLELGDEIVIVNFHEELLYKVTQINIIDPTDKEDILIQEGRDMITLLTCHPYGHNYKRYVVYCDRK